MFRRQFLSLIASLSAFDRGRIAIRPASASAQSATADKQAAAPYEAAISPGCDCAASGRRRCRDASSTWTSSNRIPTSCMSRPRPAACIAPPTTASPGRRCSSAKRCTRSATSRSISPIPTSSGSAPASAPTGRASAGATASTRPPTAARPGPTSASRPRCTSAASSLTHPIRRSSTWPRRDRCGEPAANAVCIARWMAARRGSARCMWTTTPAPPTWRWTRTIRTCSMPRPTSAAARRSASTAAVPAARCGRARTRARRGRS